MVLRINPRPPTSIAISNFSEKKAGISATVFEQDTSPTARARDWNFGIYWAQSRLAEIIPPELNAQLDAVQTDPSHVRSADSVIPIYHGVTGELLKALPAPWSVRLQRRGWLELLRGGVDIRVCEAFLTYTHTSYFRIILTLTLPLAILARGLIRSVWQRLTISEHHANWCGRNIRRRRH